MNKKIFIKATKLAVSLSFFVYGIAMLEIFSNDKTPSPILDKVAHNVTNVIKVA